MHHDIRMTARKIASRLALIEPLVYRRRSSLEPFRFKALDGPDDPPLVDPNLDDSDWQVVPPLTYWGKRDLNFVMRGRFIVPAEFDASSPGPVALFLPIGDAGDFSHPEALVYIDGEAYAAVDRHHQEIVLADRSPRRTNDGAGVPFGPRTIVLRDSAYHHLALHGWTGLLGSMKETEPGKALLMRECAIVLIDQPTRDFIAVARTALQAANLLDELEPARTRLYSALDDAFKMLDTLEPLGDRFYESVPAALETLRAGVKRAGAPLDADIIASGHAHIDVAWLWTLGQTRRKAGRTFHTVVRLMEQFPDYSFTQSQPQLYDFVRHDYPELFEAIKERVAEGRWEPVGGMWVEADCNISGPESLARQFLLGRSYFREHFGKDAESHVLWLPDVFGYAWNLPQLIKLAGMEYFFTIKIGWNQVNKMPFDSFWWQGLDGTRVLTHFSTAPELNQHGEPNLRNPATYNADLSAYTTLGSWANLQHKESQSVMLMSYGYGDGGGGPTREMNENAQELKAFPALPRVTQGKVIDFYRRLERESGDKLPVWNSELYLEIHRGTYTTQSRNKRANRKSEFLLHDAEFLATLALLLDPTFEYPSEALHRAWELVCLNQFHDIVPGSSIHEVYVESLQQYGEVRSLGEAARDAALSMIKAHLHSSFAGSGPSAGNLLVVNPTGYRRSDLVFWEGNLYLSLSFPRGLGTLRAGSGPSVEGITFAGDIYTQAVEGGMLVAPGDVEPYSVKTLKIEQGEPKSPDKESYPLHATPDLLENAYLRVELNGAGDIVRIYDKYAKREVLPPGAIGNEFQAFEDRPLNWDAWDIDIFYDDKKFLTEPAKEGGRSVRVVESGPLRATLEIKRRILNSSYTQRVSLCYNSAQLDFDTTIDWRERHVLLKVAFPVDILSPVATYEIQWGSVQRPTHRNTSWDWARFETCAQKWVDLSEGGYGVALLNDCKYGHDINGNVIRLSLLRAPTNPDPEADQGEHRFAYSLYPHANQGNASAVAARVAQRAYALNDPLIAISTGETSGQMAVTPQNKETTETRLRSEVPLLALPGADNVIIETIKQAEDRNGVIARLYECCRERGWVTLQASFPLKEAYITNLLEETLEALETDGHSIRLYIKPFQIVTIRLVPG